MGVVYRADDPDLNRKVALKLIRTGLTATDDELLRLRTEAEAAAHLDHANIIQVYETGESQGYVFLCLKYVDGQSLSRHAGAFRDKPRDAAVLAERIARAIHYAHQRGVLHRDLKPANILLDANRVPYVTDFGLAKLLDRDSALTHTGAIIGTPSYMPPEQAQGQRKAVTTASDVYGLGAILYDLLTGVPPFRGSTVTETLRKVVEEEPNRPRSLNPKVDRDLETICLKCLDKDPQRRYASAEALAGDLNRWLTGEPIQSRPIGRVERLYKWARRKPSLAALVATVAFVLSVVAPGFLAYYWWNSAIAEVPRRGKASESEDGASRGGGRGSSVCFPHKGGHPESGRPAATRMESQCSPEGQGGCREYRAES